MSFIAYESIPRAKPMEIENIVIFPESIVYTMWVLSGIGIVISLLFLTINICYREVT